MRDVRQGLVTFFVASSAALAVVAIFNFSVNPYGYYPTRWVKPVVWSSRKQKAEVMQTTFTHHPPQVLILGSSRVMKIRPHDVQQLTGRVAYNAGVDSARIEDVHALFAFARQNRAPLRELVLGLDLDAFHDNVPTDARLLATAELRPYVALATRLDWYPRVFAALISYSQLVDGGRAILRAIRGWPTDIYRFDDDGVIHYLEWEPRIAAGTFSPDLEQSKSEYDSRFAHWDQVSQPRIELLRALVADAARDGVRIRAFLTPFHGSLIQHLRETREFDRQRTEVVDILKELERSSENFNLRDFTETSSFGGDPDDYLDGSHPGEKNSAKLLKALYADGNAQRLRALQ